MTFEQWYETKKQEWNPVKLNKCSVIARSAWDAAIREKAKMLTLLDDFEDLISSACPDASMYCDDGGLADRLEELRL